MAVHRLGPKRSAKVEGALGDPLFTGVEGRRAEISIVQGRACHGAQRRGQGGYGGFGVPLSLGVIRQAFGQHT